MTHKAVELKGLSWRYNGRSVLSDVDLEIKKGSFTGIVGPNGAGKTTLLKLVLKLLSPDKDTVFIFDRDISSFLRKDLAKRISYVPQTINVDFSFSVHQIVSMGRNPHSGFFSGDPVRDSEVVQKAMKETEIENLKNKDIGSISGGELQRVIIARALAQEPDILALDEPTSHLDLNHQIRILSLVRSLSREKGITVIAVLHDFNHALEYCTSLVLMNKGKIVSSGSPEKVITPQRMKEIYGLNIKMETNPFTGKPYIINEYV
ncbi:MAG: ABC transporter [Spirochaetes bacterium]|nr:MAG: ABC transporter [Spirochaetota bacterium]